jgi:Leucine-rich repeat (LRR) protein
MNDTELLQLIQQAARDGVATLNLSNQGLSSLPPEIGQLSKLQTLDLNYNQLTSLPDAIGQLTSLRALYLNRNRLRSLPVAINKLRNLQTLHLNYIRKFVVALRIRIHAQRDSYPFYC